MAARIWERRLSLRRRARACPHPTSAWRDLGQSAMNSSKTLMTSMGGAHSDDGADSRAPRQPAWPGPGRWAMVERTHSVEVPLWPLPRSETYHERCRARVRTTNVRSAITTVWLADMCGLFPAYPDVSARPSSGRIRFGLRSAEPSPGGLRFRLCGLGRGAGLVRRSAAARSSPHAGRVRRA